MGAVFFCLQTNSRRSSLKRFHFNDDEDEDEDNEEEKFMNSDFFSMAPLSFGAENTILSCSIKICENSLFWKFYSLETKLKKIKETYEFLSQLEGYEGE